MKRLIAISSFAVGSLAGYVLFFPRTPLPVQIQVAKADAGQVSEAVVFDLLRESTSDPQAYVILQCYRDRAFVAYASLLGKPDIDNGHKQTILNLIHRCRGSKLVFCDVSRQILYHGDVSLRVSSFALALEANPESRLVIAESMLHDDNSIVVSNAGYELAKHGGRTEEHILADWIQSHKHIKSNDEIVRLVAACLGRLRERLRTGVPFNENDCTPFLGN